MRRHADASQSPARARDLDVFGLLSLIGPCADVSSTFYDDLRDLLFTMLDEDHVDADYIPPDLPNGDN